MKRLIMNEMLAWKNSAARKPLILKGVRQCGKTWLLKQFGADYYEDTAYFNFEGNDSLQKRFDGDLDVRRIVNELGVLRNKPILPGKTLVVFDEAQFCNRALVSLKYFCENAPEYHIAAAGSLLGLALSKPLSFPVGKVDFLTLRPMNFTEFLLAQGEEMLCDYMEKLSPVEKTSALFSEKLERYLKTYYIVGGMPEAVAHWAEFHDIETLETIQQRILDSYELDFAKYAPANDFPKLQAIWRSIPSQLAKENAKFIFSEVKKGWRAKDLEDALEWLIGAGLVYKVAKIEKPYMPLSAYADQSFFKLYLADVGLLRRLAKLPASIILEKNDSYKEFKGALTENYCLCEMICAEPSDYYYWKSNNTAEIDFVIQSGADIVPVEVKSERNDRSKSLAEYRKKYAPRLALKISMKNTPPCPESAGDGTGNINLPLYRVPWLKRALSFPKLAV